MGVIFSIFGKILFVLLILLAVVLILLALILFCPIHYKVSCEKEEEISVKGAVRWLSWIIYCPFSFQENQFQFVIRIFGIPLRFGGKKQKKEKRAAAEEEGEKESQKITDEENTEQQSKTIAHDEKPIDFPEEDFKEKSEPEKETKKRISSNQEEEKESFFDKAGKIREKIREKKSWVSDAKNVWKKENTRQMVCIFKDNVVHLLKKLKPKVLKGYIEFGTGDPCQTGEILGGLACLFPYYGDKITIVPDFMEKKIAGHLFIKGRISLITFVVIVIRILWNRHWKHFIHDVKGLKEAL